MDGTQAVPPTPSPGTGAVHMTLNTDSGVLTLMSGSYQNMIGFVFAAHVHGFAPPAATKAANGLKQPQSGQPPSQTWIFDSFLEVGHTLHELH